MKLSLTLILMLCLTKVFSQQNEARQGCDFLNDLHFKNGVDTITVLVTNKASVKPPPLSGELKTFYKEHKIDPLDLFFVVSFKPLNCSQIFGAACKDPDGFDIAANKPDAILQLRCIVYDKYIGNSTSPYFIVDKVTVNK